MCTPLVISIPERTDWKGNWSNYRIEAPIFQFQKGPIESWPTRSPTRRRLPFQFQKGPIESVHLTAETRRRERISIPERTDWKERLGLNCATYIVNFNSRKDRLKVATGQVLDNTGISFQFQKGPIERFSDRRRPSGAHWFQFQKGPIESTLTPQFAVDSARFQFQKGPIERWSRRTVGEWLILISIPERTDWKYLHCLADLTPYVNFNSRKDRLKDPWELSC